AKALLLLFPNGRLADSRPTPCPGMPAAVGTFFVTWTRIMKMHSVIRMWLLTGTRSMCTLEEPSTRLDIYCTAACGQRHYMIWDTLVMMNPSGDSLTRG